MRSHCTKNSGAPCRLLHLQQSMQTLLCPKVVHFVSARGCAPKAENHSLSFGNQSTLERDDCFQMGFCPCGIRKHLLQNVGSRVSLSALKRFKENRIWLLNDLLSLAHHPVFHATLQGCWALGLEVHLHNIHSWCTHLWCTGTCLVEFCNSLLESHHNRSNCKVHRRTLLLPIV